MIDFDTKIQSYRWTPYNHDIQMGNKLPFVWKCCICATLTDITENDPSKSYDCSNPRCKVKLRFIM